jgi:ABC-type uncharacterized transport system YnjBCD substrate-binding protein
MLNLITLNFSRYSTHGSLSAVNTKQNKNDKQTHYEINLHARTRIAKNDFNQSKYATRKTQKKIHCATVESRSFATLLKDGRNGSKSTKSRRSNKIQIDYLDADTISAITHQKNKQ